MTKRTLFLVFFLLVTVCGFVNANKKTLTVSANRLHDIAVKVVAMDYKSIDTQWVATNCLDVPEDAALIKTWAMAYGNPLSGKIALLQGYDDLSTLCHGTLSVNGMPEGIKTVSLTAVSSLKLDWIPSWDDLEHAGSGKTLSPSAFNCPVWNATYRAMGSPYSDQLYIAATIDGCKSNKTVAFIPGTYQNFIDEIDYISKNGKPTE